MSQVHLVLPVSQGQASQEQPGHPALRVLRVRQVPRVLPAPRALLGLAEGQAERVEQEALVLVALDRSPPSPERVRLKASRPDLPRTPTRTT